MNLLESLSVAFESLIANKMRAALTMLGVIIGVFAVITMLAIASGAREQMMTRIQSMGTNVLFIMSGQTQRGGVMGGMGSSQTLTLEDADAIVKECPSVVKTSPEVSSSAQVKYRNKNTSVSIQGTSADYPSVRNCSVSEGRYFTASDIRSVRKVATIGPTAAKDLFGEASPIGKIIRIKGIPFSIIGVMKEKGSAGGFGDPDNQLYIPVTTAMRRVFGLQNIRMIAAQAKRMDMTDQAIAEITKVLNKRHHIAKDKDSDFVIRNQAEVMAMANDMADIFTKLLGGIASVSLLVGGIGIMNIMLVSVTERTREIGIRMALGARRRDIQWQFLIEALVLSLIGGAIGIILGVLASFAVSKISPVQATVSIPSVIMSFSFAAAVGIFFGFYPARKASNLDPIDALRYE
ncbi:MAG: ABC transporter permease [Armatimonadetes bacterium]|nr:ABC transporter permease [Armatimonadota bacterium]